MSQHLAKLRLAGLVTMRRAGRRALYRARGGHVRRLVEEVFHAADHHLTGQADHDQARPKTTGASHSSTRWVE